MSGTENMFYLDLNSTLLIMANVFVFIVFVLLIIGLVRVYKLNLKREEELVKSTTYKRALTELDDARSRAISIIKESNIHADEILKDASFLSEESRLYLKRRLDEVSAEQTAELEKVSQEMLAAYTSALKEEQKRSVDTFKQLSIDLEKEVSKELDDFTNVLHTETIESEKLVQDKLNAEYQDLKEEMLRKLENDMNTILAQVSKEVIGKSIDLETQQSLVIDALERAKKEHVFGKI